MMLFPHLSFVVEVIGACLLLVMILYAVQLNRRLALLKADKAHLQKLITHFNQSTERAEASVSKLRSGTLEANESLQASISQAKQLCDDLAFMARSKLADAFAFISSPTGRAAKNIDDITRKMAESDSFDAFLKNYRDRLITPSKTAKTKDGPADPAVQGTTQPDAQPDAQRAGTAAPGAIPQPPPPPSG